MDRRAPARPFISSASCCPGLRTLSISTFPFRERRPPYKVCWAVRLPPASRRSAPSFRTSGPGRCGRWRRRARSAARCCPMCRPLPRRDIRRSNSPNGSAFSSRRELQRNRRDAQQRLACGAANQGSPGWTGRSIGGCRRSHAGRVRPPGQSRLRSLGADREGIRVHSPGLGGLAGFISRVNIDEALSGVRPEMTTNELADRRRMSALAIGAMMRPRSVAIIGMSAKAGIGGPYRP